MVGVAIQPLVAEDNSSELNLKKDTIKKIIEVQSDDLLPPPSKKTRLKQKIYIDLAEGYDQLIKGKISHGSIQERIDKERNFYAAISLAIQELQSERSLTPEEERILASDAIALYGLLVEGGIDALYQKYITEHMQDPVIKSQQLEQSPLDIQASLVEGYLQTIRKKNKETSMLNRRSITYGIEIEYNDILYQLSVLYGMRREKMSPKQLQVVEQLDVSPQWRQYYYNVQSFLASQDEFDQRIQKNYPEIESAVIEYMPAVPVFNKLGFNKHGKDQKATLEMATKPAASPKTILREIIQLRQYGGLTGNLSIHETVGGVCLTPEHTEMMDITPIVSAAGYLPWETFDNHQLEKVMNGKICLLEKYKKLTVPEGFAIDVPVTYFPFHKSRHHDYNMKPYGATAKKTPAVERRSLPTFKEGSFGNLIREATFGYLAAEAIRSVQKNPENRDETDNNLVDAWKTMIEQWDGLLATVKLTNPKNNGRFIEATTNVIFDEKHPPTTEYHYFLTKVIAEAQTNAEFQKNTRAIIREFSKKVKKQIGY